MLVRNAKKIAAIIIAMSTSAIMPYYSYGEAKTHVKPKHKKAAKPATTIGFRSGRELLFNSSPLIHNRQGKIHSGISNSIVLRKPINTHFAVDAGIKYTSFRGLSQVVPNDNSTAAKYTAAQKVYDLALPVTINYFILPEHCCVHPYIGAGFQYNLTLSNSKSSPFNSDTYTANVGNQLPGTKYISILFTQGITFRVNTKIEVNQSFHFIPCGSNTKTLGIDLGFDYRLP